MCGVGAVLLDVRMVQSVLEKGCVRERERGRGGEGERVLKINVSRALCVYLCGIFTFVYVHGNRQACWLWQNIKQMAIWSLVRHRP